jgi:hypothetical protein
MIANSSSCGFHIGGFSSKWQPRRNKLTASVEAQTKTFMSYRQQQSVVQSNKCGVIMCKGRKGLVN